MNALKGTSAALAVIAMAGFGACGSPGGPQVARLGSSGGSTSGSTSTTLPTGSPTKLLDEWASCMRRNGVPNLADPTIDANGTIHIVMPAGTGSGSASGGTGPSTFKMGMSNACGPYLQAASRALGGPGQDFQRPDPAKLLKFSQCMRANGITDFPDPSGNGLQIRTSPGSDLNPNSPTFQSASKKCAKEAGVPGLGSPGSRRGGIEITGGSGPGQAPPGDKGGAFATSGS